MSPAVSKTSSCREYKIKDMSLADFGRLEISLAEVEIAGLMSCRSEFGPSQPLKGVRISGCLHMTIQTAMLIESLTARGAQAPVVQLQRSLYSRPRRRRYSARLRFRLCLERRDTGRILVVRGQGTRLGPRWWARYDC
ncbi:hypothetical protein L6164_000036 [Bauhinia variegata]|uniref:Uncharacterized protein n=1 Tax=Bauhinia variegata TaxID=167791 RepID=A0ACB9Q7G8_BAUVA|nr:hypothetical protein L6164_000036 [Bauhinia variegata]